MSNDEPKPEDKIQISIDDLEVVDKIIIKDKEAAKKIREIKEQGLEGVYVEIGTN